jgi:hypothetical protein
VEKARDFAQQNSNLVPPYLNWRSELGIQSFELENQR